MVRENNAIMLKVCVGLVVRRVDLCVEDRRFESRVAGTFYLIITISNLESQ